MTNKNRSLFGLFLCIGATGSVALTGCSDDEAPGPGASTTAIGGAGGETGGTGGVGGGGASGGEGGEAGAGGQGGTIVLETVEAVNDEGMLLPGIDVVVSAADGTLVLHEQTDASGSVQVDVPEDGLVTVLSTYNTQWEGQLSTHRLAQTARGLAEGGTYRAVARRASPAPKNQAMDLTITTNTPFFCMLPSGTEKFLAGGSGMAGSIFPQSSASFSSFVGCPGESTYDLLLMAKDADGLTLGYAQQLALPFMPGGQDTVAVCPSQTALVETSLTMTGIPSIARGAHANVYSSSKGSDCSATLDRQSRPWPESDETFPLRVPEVGGLSPLRVQANIELQETAGGVFRAASHTWDHPDDLPATLLWQFNALAFVADVDPLDVSDPGRPRVSWTLATQGSLGDVVQSSVEWNASDGADVTWTGATSPVRDGSLKMPALPDALAEYRLAAGDTVAVVVTDHTNYEELDGLASVLAGELVSEDWMTAVAASSP